LNAVMFVLIVSGILMTLFPLFYFGIWATTIVPLYLVLFKRATEKAKTKTKEPLLTDFTRQTDESFSRYLLRRVVGFIAWNLTTVVFYWFLILYTTGSQKRFDEITDHVATGLIN